VDKGTLTAPSTGKDDVMTNGEKPAEEIRKIKPIKMKNDFIRSS
jgi:hypothetical protein